MNIFEWHTQALPIGLVHEARMPIRWGDMDAMGHVNNTVYFRYFEQARVEWMESQGNGVTSAEATAPVLMNSTCTFLWPLKAPGVAVVRVYAGMPGRSSFETFYEIRMEGDDRLYATGSGKLVWIDVQANRSTALPDSIRAGLDRALRERPFQPS